LTYQWDWSELVSFNKSAEAVNFEVTHRHIK